MKKITSIKELLEALESGNYNYYGLRMTTDHDEELISKGAEYLDPSLDAFEGSETEGEALSGTSALGVHDFMSECELENRLKDLKTYYAGHRIILIADSRQEYGTDFDEVVLGHNGYGADIVAEVEI